MRANPTPQKKKQKIAEVAHQAIWKLYLQYMPSPAEPPVEIHLQVRPKPVACHNATLVPEDQQEQVFARRVEANGIIEQASVAEPVNWCH